MLSPDPDCISADSDHASDLLQLTVNEILQQIATDAEPANVAAAFQISFDQMKLIEEHTR